MADTDQPPDDARHGWASPDSDPPDADGAATGPDPAGNLLAGLDLFDVQARAGLVAVWFAPNTDADQPLLSLEILGGQKRYARIWLRQLRGIEWGWTVGHDAVCLWSEADR